MTKEKKVSGPGVYQLKVTMQHIKPPIWRRIQLPSDYTLGDLHMVILELMEWDEDHLHEFTIGRRKFGPSDDEAPETVNDEDDVTLDMVLGTTCKKFDYLYDFGDCWEIAIDVEKRLKQEEGLAHPVCLAGARSAPPQDCGGAGGYLENLKVLKNPKAPGYEDVVEWMGEDWDSECFDIEELNERLAFMAKAPVDFDEMDEDARNDLIEQMLNEDPFLEERVMRLHAKMSDAFGIESPEEMHGILEKMDPEEMKEFALTHLAADPLEAAHEFGLLALGSDDPEEKAQYAEKALELDPQSVDARIVLANCAIVDGGLDAGIEKLREAVALAESKLGKKFFLQHRGKFAERIEARPYLRARQTLARALRFAHQTEEAITTYEDLLNLDVDDRSGARYGLIGTLLLVQEGHKARVIIDRFQEDDDPVLFWASALVQFMTLGAKAATGDLENAIERLPLAATCLLDPDTLDDLDMSTEEASATFAVIEGLGEAWQECPGAIEWLSSFVYGDDES